MNRLLLIVAMQNSKSSVKTQIDLLQQGVQVLLHAPGAVHVQVEELRDLEQVGHLLRIRLVLCSRGEGRGGALVKEGAYGDAAHARRQERRAVSPWTEAWAES